MRSACVNVKVGVGCVGVCVRVSHVAVGVVGVCVEESIAVECQCGF